MIYKFICETDKSILITSSIIISLNGYNDISNKIYRSFIKNNNNKLLYIFNILKKLLILKTIKRFYIAYKFFKLTPNDDTNSYHDKGNIYPLF